jgi:hypothetical protein
MWLLASAEAPDGGVLWPKVVIVLLVFAGLGAVAVVLARRDREMGYLRRRGQPARATIVDTHPDVTDDRTVWTLFVDYPLEGGEHLRRVKLRGSVSEQDYRYPGDQITIYYDPQSPDRERAEFRDPGEGRSLTLVGMIIVGIVICGLGAVGSGGR